MDQVPSAIRTSGAPDLGPIRSIGGFLFLDCADFVAKVAVTTELPGLLRAVTLVALTFYETPTLGKAQNLSRRRTCYQCCEPS